MLLSAAVASTTTYPVTTTADSNSGSCEPASCTLRQAFNAANAAGNADIITLPAGTYGLEYGQLEIKAPVTVSGPAGPGATTVDAQGSSRVFEVSVGVAATLEGITIAKGLVKGTSAAQAMGGGILNAGAVTLKDAVVKENTAGPADSTGTLPSGGGVQNSGTLVLIGSTIEEKRRHRRPVWRDSGGRRYRQRRRHRGSERLRYRAQSGAGGQWDFEIGGGAGQLRCCRSRREGDADQSPRRRQRRDHSGRRRNSGRRRHLRLQY